MAESSHLSEVGEVPHQPERHMFPRRQFGKSAVVSCAFQGSWFNKWQWLHYESTTDLAFCYTEYWSLVIKNANCTLLFQYTPL